MSESEPKQSRRGRAAGTKSRRMPSRKKDVATGATESGVVEQVTVAPAKPPKAVKKAAGFNLLQRGPKMQEALREALVRSEKKAKLVVGDPTKPKLLIPVLPFQMQVALRSRGLVSGTVLEIIGQEAVGKTTLKNTIYGWGMRHNCPVGDFGSEAKPMFEDRIKQCLHWDKDVAQAMYDAMYQCEVHDIASMVNEVESWLMQIRDPRCPETYVPIDIPAIIGVDSWSKLMDPGEAESFAAYGGPPTLAPKKTDKPKRPKSDKTLAREREAAKKAASKIKEIGTVSNLGSAKMAAIWCRRLPHILSVYNAMLIVIRHQTVKIDMKTRPGGGSFISEEDKAPYNNQARGGKAFPQSAAYELILTPGSKVKRVIAGMDTTVGQDIYVNINKNSFGPSFNKFSYRINTAGFRDGEKIQDMALGFSTGLPELLKSFGLDVVRYSDDDYSCATLGLDRATLAEFETAFYARGDIVDDLGRRLKIKGYGEDTCFWPEVNPAFQTAGTEETASNAVEPPTLTPAAEAAADALVEVAAAQLETDTEEAVAQAENGDETATQAE